MAKYVLRDRFSGFFYDKYSTKEYASYSAFLTDAKTWKSKGGAEYACKAFNRRYGRERLYVEKNEYL